jgi:hypothetical protein
MNESICASSTSKPFNTPNSAAQASTISTAAGQGRP